MLILTGLDSSPRATELCRLLRKSAPVGEGEGARRTWPPSTLDLNRRCLLGVGCLKCGALNFSLAALKTQQAAHDRAETTFAAGDTVRSHLFVNPASLYQSTQWWQMTFEQTGQTSVARLSDRAWRQDRRGRG